MTDTRHARHQVWLIVEPCYAGLMNQTHDAHIWRTVKKANGGTDSGNFHCYFWCAGWVAPQ